MKSHLEITAFVSGAVVMILELDGSRIIAPYLGTSTIVWTGLIGIILGSLSIGYWWGGKLSDKGANFFTLGKILSVSAVLVLYISYFKNILALALYFSSDLILSTIVGTTILFAPATIFLGMVTPYVARLKMKNIETSGSAIGSLYAVSTLGSITGTFLGGFVLISYFGSTTIILILSSILFLLSGTSFWNSDRPNRKVFTLICVIGAMLIFVLKPPQSFGMALVDDIDTEYSRVWIFDSIDASTARPVRYLSNNMSGLQSGMFLDKPDELLFPYAKLFDLTGDILPNLNSALMIGAGAYSFPKHFAVKYPKAHLDVVEIDTKLKNIAEKYFGLKPNSQITVIDEDGRTYLNRNTSKYQIIYNDAFLSQLNIPFQLTTKEAVQKMFDSLDEKGVVMTNILSATEGAASSFLSAEFETYKSVFPEVYLIKVTNVAVKQLQNIMLVAFKTKGATLPLSILKSKFKINFENIFTPKKTSDSTVLTDEFAPIEKYMTKMLI